MRVRRSSQSIREISVQQDVNAAIPDAESPSHTTTRLSAKVGSAAVIAALALAFNNPWFAAVIALVVVTLLFGVVLPAALSAKPSRRRAARAVLRELRRWFRQRP